MNEESVFLCEVGRKIQSYIQKNEDPAGNILVISTTFCQRSHYQDVLDRQLFRNPGYFLSVPNLVTFVHLLGLRNILTKLCSCSSNKLAGSSQGLLSQNPSISNVRMVLTRRTCCLWFPFPCLFFQRRMFGFIKTSVVTISSALKSHLFGNFDIGFRNSPVAERVFLAPLKLVDRNFGDNNYCVVVYCGNSSFID